jgi:hypothetical protein
MHGLADAAHAVGSRFADDLTALGEGLPDDVAAAALLEDSGRPFDAARASLWAAERGEPTDVGAAAAVFERLGARGHLERARSVA